MDITGIIQAFEEGAWRVCSVTVVPMKSDLVSAEICGKEIEVSISFKVQRAASITPPALPVMMRWGPNSAVAIKGLSAIRVKVTKACLIEYLERAQDGEK